MTANNPHRWEYLRAVRKDGKTPSPCACTPFRLSVGVTAADSFPNRAVTITWKKKGKTPSVFRAYT